MESVSTGAAVLQAPGLPCRASHLPASENKRAKAKAGETLADSGGQSQSRTANILHPDHCLRYCLCCFKITGCLLSLSFPFYSPRFPFIFFHFYFSFPLFIWTASSLLFFPSFLSSSSHWFIPQILLYLIFILYLYSIISYVTKVSAGYIKVTQTSPYSWIHSLESQITEMQSR